MQQALIAQTQAFNSSVHNTRNWARERLTAKVHEIKVAAEAASSLGIDRSDVATRLEGVSNPSEAQTSLRHMLTATNGHDAQRILRSQFILFLKDLLNMLRNVAANDVISTRQPTAVLLFEKILRQQPPASFDELASQARQCFVLLLASKSRGTRNTAVLRAFEEVQAPPAAPAPAAPPAAPRVEVHRLSDRSASPDNSSSQRNRSRSPSPDAQTISFMRRCGRMLSAQMAGMRAQLGNERAELGNVRAELATTKQQNAALTAQLADLPQPCIICYTNQPTTVFVPCGHTFCGECAAGVRTHRLPCPKCRCKIKESIRFYT